MIDERADSDWANLKAVAPFTGAWIEIVTVVDQLTKYAIVAPFTGAWIEMKRRILQPKSSMPSHPSRVRGLK